MRADAAVLIVEEFGAALMSQSRDRDQDLVVELSAAQGEGPIAGPVSCCFSAPICNSADMDRCISDCYGPLQPERNAEVALCARGAAGLIPLRFMVSTAWDKAACHCSRGARTIRTWTWRTREVRSQQAGFAADP